jgi:hypothetical protein
VQCRVGSGHAIRLVIRTGFTVLPISVETPDVVIFLSHSVGKFCSNNLYCARSLVSTHLTATLGVYLQFLQGNDRIMLQIGSGQFLCHTFLTGWFLPYCTCCNGRFYCVF